MKQDKALSPDGYSAHFSSMCGQVIREDMLAIVNSFSSGKLLGEVDSTLYPWSLRSQILQGWGSLRRSLAATS